MGCGARYGTLCDFRGKMTGRWLWGNCGQLIKCEFYCTTKKQAGCAFLMGVGIIVETLWTKDSMIKCATVDLALCDFNGSGRG